MTNRYRIIAHIAKVWLCVVALLMLHELTAHKPMQSPELFYSYLVWGLPPVLILLLAWLRARTAGRRSSQARAARGAVGRPVKNTGQTH